MTKKIDAISKSAAPKKAKKLVIKSEPINAEQMRQLLSIGDIDLNPIRGAWPEFRLLHKNKLCIDLVYQREPQRPLVVDIAGLLHRHYFQACILSDRGNESYFVLEGGQRWSAALIRDDVDYIPCLIYKFGSISEEAQAFKTINKRRRAVSAIEQFNAVLAQNNDEGAAARKLVEVVEAGGFKISASGSQDTFTCIGVLQNIYAKHISAHPDHFEDLILLLGYLEHNGGATFRTMGYIVNAISDLIDISYGGSFPDASTLEHLFKKVDFNELVNDVDSEYNSRKTGNNPGKRTIFREHLVKIIERQAAPIRAQAK